MLANDLCVAPLLAIGLGPTELVILGIVAVLLFGKNLPSVARSLGGSYREFKKGLTDIQSTIDSTVHDFNTPTSYSSTSSYEDYDDYDEPQAPKFEPPPAEPQDADAPTKEMSQE